MVEFIVFYTYAIIILLPLLNVSLGIIIVKEVFFQQTKKNKSVYNPERVLRLTKREFITYLSSWTETPHSSSLGTSRTWTLHSASLATKSEKHEQGSHETIHFKQLNYRVLLVSLREWVWLSISIYKRENVSKMDEEFWSILLYSHSSKFSKSYQKLSPPDISSWYTPFIQYKI